MTVKPSN